MKESTSNGAERGKSRNDCLESSELEPMQNKNNMPILVSNLSSDTSINELLDDAEENPPKENKLDTKNLMEDLDLSSCSSSVGDDKIDMNFLQQFFNNNVQSQTGLGAGTKNIRMCIDSPSTSSSTRDPPSPLVPR